MKGGKNIWRKVKLLAWKQKIANITRRKAKMFYEKNVGNEGKNIRMKAKGKVFESKQKYFEETWHLRTMISY